MANDLGAWDLTKPDGATEQVSVLDDYLIEVKEDVVGWAGIEHDLKGRHKLAQGNTSARPSTSGGSPAVTGTPYFNTQTGAIEIYNGSAWVPVCRKSDSFVYNGSFEKWWNNGHNTPCGWTRSASFTLTRETTQIKFGSVSLEFSRVGSDRQVTQRLDSFWDLDIFKNQYLTLYCQVRSSAGSAAKIGVDTGSGYTYSDPNSTTSAWEVLTLKVLVPSGASKVEIAVAIRDNNATVQFDGITAVLGQGHDGYQECTFPLRNAILVFGAGASLAAGSTWFFGMGASLTEAEVSIPAPFRAVVREIRGNVSDGSAIMNIGGAADSGIDTTPSIPLDIVQDHDLSFSLSGHVSAVFPRVSVVLEEVPLA